MTVLLSNNAYSELATELTIGSTTVELSSGGGDLFPSISPGDWFPLTVESTATGELEIMRVTAISGDILTVQRSQEGTDALEFDIGDWAELRFTEAVHSSYNQDDSSEYATAAQGDTADTALQSSDIGTSLQAHNTVLDNTTASYTTAEETKLGDIEPSATADQTKADIDALNIDASTLNNLDSSYFRDATNLNAGTVPDARLPTSVFDDTTYSAGSGLTFAGTVINIDNPFNPSGDYASLRARDTTKDDVGLSVVDNTSDADKPISTLQQNALDIKIDSSDRGIINGVATLDSNTKIPLSQINDAILGQVAYNGTWNASTNTPTLPATPDQKGDYYIVSTSGTFESIDFVTGDWIISNGSVWEKVDNTDAVSSVSGRTGNVVVGKSDVGLSNVRNVDAYSKIESNSNYATDSQGTLADNAQPKESGKGLSSNDYTNIEKSKLTGIESNATNNDTNAQLRARSSHTGTQAVSTITGLADAATTTVSTIRAGTTKTNVGLSDVDNYSRAHYDGRYLATGAKADDSDKLDGLNSTQFIRLDTGTIPEARLPASALIGDTNTTYSAGTGISLSGTVFNVDSPFNASGTYASLRAQATTKADVGLSNLTNLNVDVQDTGNTIMARDSSGDTFARLFRSTYSSTNSNIDGIYTTQTIGGDYMRPSTPSQVKSSMGLGNVDDYSRAHYDSRYLATGAKASDSDQLDGLNSTQFVRSDADDTMTGNLTLPSVRTLNTKYENAARNEGVTVEYNETSKSLEYNFF